MNFENFMFILDIIYSLVFISLIVFGFTYAYWSKATKKFVFQFIIVYFCLNIFMVWTDNQAAVNWSRLSAKQKACFANVRVLTGAVEMYNYGCSDSYMKDLDIDKLTRTGYLKHSLDLPTKNCFYKNMGDLTNDGVIYCVIHGFQELHYLTEENIKKSDIYSRIYNDIKNRKETNTFNLKKFLADPANLYIVRLLFFPSTLNRHRIHEYYNDY